MAITSTTGFMKAFGNHLASLPALSLTIGVDLFVENMLDSPEVGEDSVVIYDRGFEVLPEFGHTHLLWSLSISMLNSDRLAAMESVRAVHDEIVGTKFRATSDVGETFKVLSVRSSEPGVTLLEKLDSGRFLAEATVQLQVIPT